AQLGALVRQALLGDGRCASVPVVAHSRPGREWVFLVGPAWGRPMTRSTLDGFAACGGRVLDAGQRIWLPMSDHATGWRWLSPPVNATAIPSRTSVLAVARECLGRIELSSAWT